MAGDDTATLAVGRFTLQLAPGWQAEFEEDCVCLTRPDGYGILFISYADKANAPVAREDLQQLADAELPGSAELGPTKMGNLLGLHATYVEDDSRWHRFYLGYGTLLLLISYNVALAYDGTEDDEVLRMLRTLEAAGDPWD